MTRSWRLRARKSRTRCALQPMRWRVQDIRVERLPSPVPFADVVGWHKTVIEYEVAHAHPGLDHQPEVSAGLREAIARGRSTDDRAYGDALLAIDMARDRFLAATAHVDALIFPAAPDVAPAGMKTGDPRFIVPFTAFGGPIVSIPVGFGAGGLPLGLMLIGAPGSDAALADHCRRCCQGYRAAPLTHAARRFGPLCAETFGLKHRGWRCTVRASGDRYQAN